ncbi:hypothetical protein TNIN_64641 [Trichonephila inaurata madagascariensis]|uniref:Uncharacterized protein n=1 Tax=Trichonephila inaurata madagascariensis TaxID=2747483 RepID=A0A8X7BQG1_9ARAC|nr:hypothetical protein TNIN_64641 [Trichonephila inaurata madagascariensis]
MMEFSSGNESESSYLLITFPSPTRITHTDINGEKYTNENAIHPIIPITKPSRNEIAFPPSPGEALFDFSRNSWPRSAIPSAVVLPLQG